MKHLKIEDLLIKYRPLMLSLANKYSGVCAIEDLMSEASIALLECVETYKDNSNIGFGLYVKIIINYKLLDYINKFKCCVSFSKLDMHKIRFLSIEVNKYISEHGSMPDVGILLKKYNSAFHGGDFYDVYSMLDFSDFNILEEYYIDSIGNMKSLSDKVSDTITPETIVCSNILITEMLQIVNKLPDIDRRIIVNYYGIGVQRSSITDISKTLNITKQAVSLRHKDIIAKIRRIYDSKEACRTSNKILRR